MIIDRANQILQLMKSIRLMTAEGLVTSYYILGIRKELDPLNR